MFTEIGIDSLFGWGRKNLQNAVESEVTFLESGYFPDELHPTMGPYMMYRAAYKGKLYEMTEDVYHRFCKNPEQTVSSWAV